MVVSCNVQATAPTRFALRIKQCQPNKATNTTDDHATSKPRLERLRISSASSQPHKLTSAVPRLPSRIALLSISQDAKSISSPRLENKIMAANQRTPLTLPSTCDTCQYCDNCDSHLGLPRTRLRFCDHAKGRAYVELKDVMASGHDCPATAPLRRGTNSRQQASNSQTPQSGHVPVGHAPEHDASRRARQEVEVDGYEAFDDSRTHVGDNYTFEPRVEGKRLYRNLKAGGTSRSHIGNNYSQQRTTGVQATDGGRSNDRTSENRMDGENFPFGG